MHTDGAVGLCEFVQFSEFAECRKCGRRVRGTHDVVRLYAQCSLASGHLANGSGLDCQSRGLVVRSARVECCGGQVRRPKVYACGLHLAADGMSGECSIEKVDGIRNCEACIRAGEHERK